MSSEPEQTANAVIAKDREVAKQQRLVRLKSLLLAYQGILSDAKVAKAAEEDAAKRRIELEKQAVEQHHSVRRMFHELDNQHGVKAVVLDRWLWIYDRNHNEVTSAPPPQDLQAVVLEVPREMLQPVDKLD